MKRNLPTDEGRELGVQLARIADRAAERWQDQLGFVPVRCGSCAFRAGTVPNGCLPTLANAVKCAVENDPFKCHEFKGWRDGSGEPVTTCAGYMLAQSEMRGIGEAPWQFIAGGPEPQQEPVSG